MGAAPVTGREALGSPRAAFEVVDRFEQAVARYTGAPYCVAVDSCTNALFLALVSWRNLVLGVRMSERQRAEELRVYIPTHTYVGVAQAVRNAGFGIDWTSKKWEYPGMYYLHSTQVWDAAKRFTSGMYLAGTKMCVSFQAGKILPIGRGGAILHDSPEFDKWARRARFDGRTQGGEGITSPGWHCYMDPPSAARGLWLMTYLPEHNPDQTDTYEDLSELEAFR